VPRRNEAISVCCRLATGAGCSANRAVAGARSQCNKFALNARYIVEPVYDREELIVADLNLNEIDHEFLTLDVSGYYSRHDVFTFETKAQSLRSDLNFSERASASLSGGS